ncbi:hypothetical protein BHM03_00045241 [Ensete ventricosum]|uniref:Uncharacterized protein n=1 Tax=Ensete ventricosum TaxID=4639 RepID=A0A445MKR8_ENSVE|nr:hypothetical protein BHM03_00045241 [Ensete ventricosum]
MVRSWFFTVFIISALLSLSMSQEYGRRTTLVRSSEAVRSPSDPEEGVWEVREMVETTMDYKEPGANTNPRSGLSPPPPT